MGDSVADPLVTVIAVSYNHERFVEESLESIRAQTYKHIELIICDDASSDRSVEVIRTWLERTGTECTFVPHERNKGMLRTLNDTLALATGDYVAMVAADDAWFPQKTEAQVRQFQSLPPSVGVLYSDAVVVDENGEPYPGSFITRERSFDQPPEGDLSSILLRGNFIPAMTTMVRRECYERVGNFDEELAFEDWDMWLRLSRHYEFRFTPGPLVRYRVLATSVAGTLGERGLISAIAIYRKWLASGGGEEAFVRSRIATVAFELSQLVPAQRLHYLRFGLSWDKRPRALALAALAVTGIRFSSVRRLWASARMRLARSPGTVGARPSTS